MVVEVKSQGPKHLLTFGFWLLTSLFLFLLSSNELFALEDISVSASLDSTSLYEGWPIKGTLDVTHDVNQKVDESAVSMDGKSIKISLLRDVKISPDSPLTVSIYHFTLPSQKKGMYMLPPISLKVGGKTYKTLSLPYEVQGPVIPPPVAPGATQESLLKLEAFVDGPKELYPGQKTKLTYRYIYRGNIALSKEVLPMLEAEGLLKIGRTDINNYVQKNSSIFEVSQEVEAVKPGTYSWGPSIIEGIVYVEDALGNRRYTTTKLVSEVPSVQLIVQPFPSKGKPASFNGAFGQFTFSVSLAGPAKISVEDPIVLDVAIAGTTTNWDHVTLPELCCQPGFAGFFKLSDLPSIGKMQDHTKRFTVTINPLSSAIKSIPAIQFSYFEPEKNEYKTLNSNPIAIDVSPAQDIARGNQDGSKQKSYNSGETVVEWMQIYRQMAPIELNKTFPLYASDLKNRAFGSWWVLWLIPFSIALLLLQWRLKAFLKEREGYIKPISSQEIYHEMLKAPPSPQFFQMLKRCLILSLFEHHQISSAEMEPEELPLAGIAGEVGTFLVHVDSVRYTGATQDNLLYKEVLEEGKKLYRKIAEGHA